MVIKGLTSHIGELVKWAKRFGLTFSKDKCVAMTLKGGRKPNYSSR